MLAFLQIKRFLMIELFEESWMKTDAIEKNLLFKHQRKDDNIIYYHTVTRLPTYAKFISLQVCTFLLLLHATQKKKGFRTFKGQESNLSASLGLKSEYETCSVNVRCSVRVSS